MKNIAERHWGIERRLQREAKERHAKPPAPRARGGPDVAMGMAGIIVGVTTIVLSPAADALGIGQAPGFGWIQQLGTAVGLVVLALGIWMALRGRAKDR